MIMDNLVGGGFICAGRMSGTDMCPTNMVVCPMIFNALDLAAEADDAWTEELLIEGNPNCRAFNALPQPARPRRTTVSNNGNTY
jgi:hypothetical protein